MKIKLLIILMFTLSATLVLAQKSKRICTDWNMTFAEVLESQPGSEITEGGYIKCSYLIENDLNILIVYDFKNSKLFETVVYLPTTTDRQVVLRNYLAIDELNARYGEPIMSKSTEGTDIATYKTYSMVIIYEYGENLFGWRNTITYKSLEYLPKKAKTLYKSIL